MPKPSPIIESPGFASGEKLKACGCLFKKKKCCKKYRKGKRCKKCPGK